MTSLTSWTLEMEFSGSGAGWTNVTADVRANPAPAWSYGVMGNGPLDRVAGAGTLTFGLENSTQNSGGKLGYYSPGNANARSGFDMGIRVRLSLVFGGVTYYKFIGTLIDIDPVPGQYRERVTLCSVADWLDDAAITKIAGLTVQVGKRPDELIASVVGNMTRQPVSTSYAAAQLTYPYALDTIEDESTTPLTELSKITMSEMGYLYVKGDTTGGGKLVFEDRRARLNPGASSATLTNTMVAMRPKRPRDLIFNVVKALVHPRKVDSAATTIVYQLDQTNPPAIAAGETITIVGQYRDPNQQAVRFGGLNVATAASGSGYAFGTAIGDTSLTSALTVNQTIGGNSATFELINGGAVSGFVTLLRLYGQGVYDYYPITLKTTDSTSRSAYGDRTLTLNMDYESRTYVGSTLAAWYLSKYKDPRYVIDGVDFIGNSSTALMTAALAIEPGALVTITETVTGISTQYWVNGVSYRLEPGNILHASWVLAPVLDTTAYWVLGTSTLGVTTKLAP